MDDLVTTLFIFAQSAVLYSGYDFDKNNQNQNNIYNISCSICHTLVSSSLNKKNYKQKKKRNYMDGRCYTQHYRSYEQVQNNHIDTRQEKNQNKENTIIYNDSIVLLSKFIKLMDSFFSKRTTKVIKNQINSILVDSFSRIVYTSNYSNTFKTLCKKYEHYEDYSHYYFAPALSIIAYLRDYDDLKDPCNLCNQFVKFTLTGKNVASVSLIHLASLYLQKCLICSHAFHSILVPAIDTKLRTNFEGSLGTIHAILGYLRLHKSKEEKIRKKSHHTVLKLISSLVQLLKSPRLYVRNLASLSLVHFSMISTLTGSDNTGDNTCYVDITKIKTVVNILMNTLSVKHVDSANSSKEILGTRLILSFIHPSERIAAYRVLKNLAMSITNMAVFRSYGIQDLNDPQNDHWSYRNEMKIAWVEILGAIEVIVDQTLGILVGYINKEVHKDSRKEGIESLVSFMILIQRIYQEKNNNKHEQFLINEYDNLSGYAQALEYLSEPIRIFSLRKKANKVPISSGMMVISTTNDVRLRFGALVTSYMMDMYTLKSILKGLFFHGSKDQKNDLLSGLHFLVESAIKKHSHSSLVAQVDGLLATFFLLMLIVDENNMQISTSSQLSLTNLSPSFLEAVLFSQKNSFLYSKAMIDAYSKRDPIVGLILHFVIGLCCKVQMQVIPQSKNIQKYTVVDMIKTVSNLSGPHGKKKEEPTTAAYILACCITYNFISNNISSHSSISYTIQTVIECSSSNAQASDAIIRALFLIVNKFSIFKLISERVENLTRTVRELHHPININISTKNTSVRSLLGYTNTSNPMNHDSIRIITKKLLLLKRLSNISNMDILCEAMVLMHLGTTSNILGRKQKIKVTRHTFHIFKDVVFFNILKKSETGSNGGTCSRMIILLAKSIVQLTTSWPLSDTSIKEGGKGSKLNNTIINSPFIHEASLSLLSSLSLLAGDMMKDKVNQKHYSDCDDYIKSCYKFIHSLCVTFIAKKLADVLDYTMVHIEAISKNDVDLYKSTFVGLDGVAKAWNELDHYGKNNAYSLLEEEIKVKNIFHEYVNREDEKQKTYEFQRVENKSDDINTTVDNTLTKPFSPDSKVINDQAWKKEELYHLLNNQFTRTLTAIRTLALSDRTIGNAILPVVCKIVVSVIVSSCVAITSLSYLKDLAFNTLVDLVKCVHEIDDKYSFDVARALVISCKKDENSLTALALPSLCNPMAFVISLIDKQENYLLSINSFSFLFPILQAVLTGTRTPVGCERTLHIINVHTKLLFVRADTSSQNAQTIAHLRKEMAFAVLKLLSHDWYKTFVQPSPFQTLVNVYCIDNEEVEEKTVEKNKMKRISISELTPLLGEYGALGGCNARLASMMVLGSIVESHPNLLRKNPLVENRVWLNCFVQEENIRKEARKTWFKAHYGITCNLNGTIDSEAISAFIYSPPPSKMFATPLLPLLGHKDEHIALAASRAFAFAMIMNQHANKIGQNIEKLCRLYINAYPTTFEKNQENDKKIPNSKTSIRYTHGKGISLAVTTAKRNTQFISCLPKKYMNKPNKPVSVIAALTSSTSQKKMSLNMTKKQVDILVPKSNIKVFKENVLETQFQKVSARKETFIVKDDSEKIFVRSGVLRVFNVMVNICTRTFVMKLELVNLKLLVNFLVAYGLADGNVSVRELATNTIRDVVATCGISQKALTFLMPSFEKTLASGLSDKTLSGSLLPTKKILEDYSSKDRRKEAVVVALGSAAMHLQDDKDEDSKKIQEIIHLLIKTLSTPSENVQSSVSTCLYKLILMKKNEKMMQDQIENILSNIMKDCFDDEGELSSRRGAAYGIAAVVKGTGIANLEKFEIMKCLEHALECSRGSSLSYKTKESALFVIEILSYQLGMLFEPYVIHLLPLLLKTFADVNIQVRSAANLAMESIMSKLSGHGVKLLLPAVLSGLEHEDWRTKQASIHMLSAMSHGAPKQFAFCLPKVIPKLTEAFNCTHKLVKRSAEETLNEISNIISSPEISQISLTLLKALMDPSNGTMLALKSLLDTEFLHAIDPPSLALIVPILHRGLRDRSAFTKRCAALIIGNICAMIDDPRDFVPYLKVLLSDLKLVLLDPTPDCRRITAKTLGSLTRSLGESRYPELRPWLMGILEGQNNTSVERSGAAQGLTEILCAGGVQLALVVMKEVVLPMKDSTNVCTREGMLWVLVYIPSALGKNFAVLINDTFPALITALTDESDALRDVAMIAGRMIIKSHGKIYHDRILPSLEEGICNEDYRIRVASLQMLGNLLAVISGIYISKGDGDTQEDIKQAEKAQVQIEFLLGPEKNKRVLSRIYLRRSDSIAVVRENAIQVWRSVVSVTPRTLRKILDELLGQIFSSLSSEFSSDNHVSAKCLGEIVGKLGDAVLPEILALLHNLSFQSDSNTRLGSLSGLVEVIACVRKEQIFKYIDRIVNIVKNALCDTEECIRKVAAACFHSLFKLIGNKALDEVAPVLLTAVEKSGDDNDARTNAVNGITGILSVQSRELSPILFPRLLRKPISINHASALGTVCFETGRIIHMYLSSIIPNLILELSTLSHELIDVKEQERKYAIRNCLRLVCSSVEQNSVYMLVYEILNTYKSDKKEVSKEICRVLQMVVEGRMYKKDYYGQIQTMYKHLLNCLNDESKGVLKAANSVLAALVENVPLEELINHIEFIRNALGSIVSDARRRKGGVGDGEFLLPGFNMHNGGLEALLPIYQRGILYGNSTVRGISIEGLRELISLTKSNFLGGSLIIKMTGTILRVFGERNSLAVKVAILKTLRLLLVKGAIVLRGFAPQFQTTFLKSLSDPSCQVRVEAVSALASLMAISTRVDQLLNELVLISEGRYPINKLDFSRGTVDKKTTLESLAVVMKYGGFKTKIPQSITLTLDVGKQYLFMRQENGIRKAAAKVVSYACELLGVEKAESVVQELLLSNTSSDCSDTKHGMACFCYRIMSSTMGGKIRLETHYKLSTLVKVLLFDNNDSVKEASCVAIGALLGSCSYAESLLNKLRSSILKCMDQEQNSDIIKSIAKGLCIAVYMNSNIFEGSKGLPIMNMALKYAIHGPQHIQLVFNNFLWLALKVKDNSDGLERYTHHLMNENVNLMRSIYSNVLVKMKDVELEI